MAVEVNLSPKVVETNVSNNNNNNNNNACDSDDDEKPLSSRLLRPNRVSKASSGERLGDVLDSDDDEKPLSLRVRTPLNSTLYSSKSETNSSDDEAPLSLRVGQKSVDAPRIMPLDEGKKTKKRAAPEGCSRQSRAKKLKITKDSSKKTKNSQYAVSMKTPPDKWKGKEWSSLEHNGVLFPPPYVPHGVKMLYDGQPVDLTPEQEEVASMYASKLETDHARNPVFNRNFFNDWRKILGEKHVIKEFERCDFKPIHEWLTQVAINAKEERKNMSKEEKAALDKQKSANIEKYKWAVVDGVREQVGNFRVEQPDLFKGRGDCPKTGKLKKRILPSDITINIGKDAPIPECPIPGERWKEVIHDDTVTWLARWDDPVKPNQCKYVFLAASSRLKGKNDMEKYQKARELKNHINKIRKSYTKDFKSKDVTIKQTAVATYFIDKLALRAGNEKDDDEADTLGCCTLKVENVKQIPPNILEFDFLGKDSIRFYQKFETEPLVFKAIEQLRKGKQPQDQLFDKLDTHKLNTHLKTFMPDLTAKVFRTYHASMTLNNLLWEEVDSDDVKQKLEIYKNANKQVAILCNHQRSIPKSHNTSMEKTTEKIRQLKTALRELQKDLDQANIGKQSIKKRKFSTEALENKIVKQKEKIRRMEMEMESKEDLKTIALNTSKTNYLDPRITVSWCKRNEVPIEKIFSKTYMAKFIWAMDVEPTFRF
ncbi:DNA topoisomerase 1 beta-like [Silene latifolia]|uniref:DNA topoisomerase 1 beta-like n=1 Tax=Silene latifolia TaxID=37657 RepID=UPI003D776CE3